MRLQKMHLLFILILTATQLSGQVLLTNLDQFDQSAPRTEPPMPYDQYLWQVGQESHLHFTFEYLASSVASSTNLIFPLIMNSRGRQYKLTREAVMRLLSVELTGFDVRTNTQASNVLHLIQSPLNGNATNPLEQSISVQYTGNLSGYIYMNRAGQTVSNGIGLVQNIAQGLPELVLPNWSMLPFEHTIIDNKTIVQVDAKGQTVRDILTSCLPIDRYKPFLWRAVTRTNGLSNVTEVRFYGQTNTKIP